MQRESAKVVCSLAMALSMVLTTGCRASRQTVSDERTTAETAILDSIAQTVQGRRRLTVQWWGVPPTAVVPNPPIKDTPLSIEPHPTLSTHEPPKSGGYSIELIEEEQSKSVSRDTQAQTSSSLHLTQTKSEPNSRLFYLGLALGLTLSVLYLIHRVRSKIK
ncbi:MAG: hypothetical protein PUK66_07725 [Bacteroidales bacterium]|uniref:hypothetical protein n=1 Tax=Porphyromonas sp. TaxID=1924944 RepID=UPI002975B69E|nr:hypothetical protein [Porphyromonas sp.]MDD7438703.1 hypothetical protein [Bacteroidales bacterium]MDY3066961.1 hypothetical protein [Porphyromonas sp.]